MRYRYTKKTAMAIALVCRFWAGTLDLKTLEDDVRNIIEV
jgi:hypothetical protein